MLHTSRFLISVILFFSSTVVVGKDIKAGAKSEIKSEAEEFQFPHIVDQDKIKFELFPRAPDQIASFYEARGFPKKMIDVLKQQCFITVRIHNKRDELLWLELENWAFTRNGKIIQRKHRNEWIQFWKKLNMPKHNQATFRWTLLPETLDYLPDEREGGNLILPRADGDITLTAKFATGDNKQGKVILIKYDQFSCANNK